MGELSDISHRAVNIRPSTCMQIEAPNSILVPCLSVQKQSWAFAINRTGLCRAAGCPIKSAVVSAAAACKTGSTNNAKDTSNVFILSLYYKLMT
ncbi:MAG: hypothetical protein ACJA1F_002924 [Paracoccaceae bacterium]|jgi:hypothetical protein